MKFNKYIFTSLLIHLMISIFFFYVGFKLRIIISIFLSLAAIIPLIILSLLKKIKWNKFFFELSILSFFVLYFLYIDKWMLVPSGSIEEIIHYFPFVTKYVFDLYSIYPINSDVFFFIHFDILLLLICTLSYCLIFLFKNHINLTNKILQNKEKLFPTLIAIILIVISLFSFFNNQILGAYLCAGVCFIALIICFLHKKLRQTFNVAFFTILCISFFSLSFYHSPLLTIQSNITKVDTIYYFPFYIFIKCYTSPTNLNNIYHLSYYVQYVDLNIILSILSQFVLFAFFKIKHEKKRN